MIAAFKALFAFISAANIEPSTIRVTIMCSSIEIYSRLTQAIARESDRLSNRSPTGEAVILCRICGIEVRVAHPHEAFPPSPPVNLRKLEAELVSHLRYQPIIDDMKRRFGVS